ncbi:Mediator of RNA polymerase II transcription subunit 17 [Armadillidium nasatum]|uniref:Mediator of RNA polymerase II transcription subunit 17 n=1 Tax=Armadillidium nasatum TaxID=96803 RepID=A0A5N5TCP4_9CRUS|nr:Mediator of RNA polymerase II transcription subunit 17 [Armadillidium nasatum]
MTEVCVLHDLLQIVKEKRYMVLDAVQGVHPEPKQYLQFLALKKSLNNAANILLNGADRLRSAQTDVTRGRQNSDFHIELLRLRQNWRLKKVGNIILGDLSYRTAGSSFKHTGIFEVTKADEGQAGPNALSVPGNMSPMSPIQQNRPTSSLKVTVPAELEGSAYIFVCIRKDEENICNTRVQGLPFVARDGHWQQKLECAQNVLFCKELFSQLAREAVSLQPPIPHLVVGNQITSTIFPGIHLLIALCHSDTDGQKKKIGPGSISTGSGTSITGAVGGASGGTTIGLSKTNHDEVLEHSLHQLLHRTFLSSANQPLPQPVYGPVGVPKKRRIAGPEGVDRNQLLQATKSETILEQIIRQAQHNFLRLRTMYVIDQLALELKDPLIISHWNLFNSPTQSCVRINIVTQGYDSVLRTTLVIQVFEKTLKCICCDGKVMTLSFEPQELRNLLFCQISQHNVASVQCFARYMGWTVLTSENSLGVGSVEPLGNSSAVVLASPTGNKTLAVRSSPTKGVTVFVSSSPRNDFYPSAVVNDRRWENLGGAWHEVRLERMEGRNFLNKIELLMASLTAQA